MTDGPAPGSDSRPTYPQSGFPPAPPPMPSYGQQLYGPHPYGQQPYGQAPQPFQEASGRSWSEIPTQLRPVVVLLLVNLTLSVLLTVVTIVMRHSLVTYQLDHRHITDPVQREAVRSTYITGIVSRAIGNIVVSVVYVFLVRALVRGRRWAYRRVIWLGAVGIVGLVLLQTTPYPTWMRIEQLAQAVVLAALLYFVTRPAVRDHFASGLPGRDVGRFNRGSRY